jgi:peptide/nickel transport system substrate-binding protein
VHKNLRSLGVTTLTLALALLMSACGSSSKSGSGATSTLAGNSSTLSSTPTITVLMGTAPDSLDPGLGATAQSAEATWLSYTGLVTYARAGGVAGTKLIPGLAESLPKISTDGKTYTFTLRKGLVYSNGRPVKAGDFAHTIERAIKLNWGNKQFFTQAISGAEAYDKGTVSSISGISSDQATGRITIKLTAPFGAFLNVLAFPAASPVPGGTAMRSLANNPPPGVGPYKIEKVVPNQSFSVIRNPRWSAENIPGIPAGHANIDVKIVSNNQSEAEQVLSNSADVFDFNDSVPGTLLPQVKSRAAGRYAAEPTVSTDLFFLNTKVKPFDNQLVREAVSYAIDRRALARLGGGLLAPACYLLPVGMPGHPTAPCPYGDPNGAPNLTKARELVKQAGQAGAPVTVWGRTSSPHKEYTDYYASVLISIGLKATEKLIADAQYYTTVGDIASKPQTGLASFSQDFPNPADFYQLLDAASIQPQNNHNLSQVNDPHIQSELAALSGVPSSKLDTVSGRWQGLDEYVARKGYIAVFGYEEASKFLSDKLDFAAAIFHPVYGNDWSSLQPK